MELDPAVVVVAEAPPHQAAVDLMVSLALEPAVGAVEEAQPHQVAVVLRTMELLPKALALELALEHSKLMAVATASQVVAVPRQVQKAKPKTVMEEPPEEPQILAPVRGAMQVVEPVRSLRPTVAVEMPR